MAESQQGQWDYMQQLDSRTRYRGKLYRELERAQRGRRKTGRTKDPFETKRFFNHSGPQPVKALKVFRSHRLILVLPFAKMLALRATRKCIVDIEVEFCAAAFR